MAILLTSFMVVAQLGMLDTLAVLIIPGVAPRGQMFFLRQFYLNMPVAVEEAALIDGATRWQIFLQDLRAAVAGLFVVVGIGVVHRVLELVRVADARRLEPRPDADHAVPRDVPLGARQRVGLLMAGSTLAALPTIALVLFFQRYIVDGVRISGIK